MRSSASIRRALSMPLEERRARQAALMQALTANDIQDWPDKFLAALTGGTKTSPLTGLSGEEACCPPACQPAQSVSLDSFDDYPIALRIRRRSLNLQETRP